MRRIPYAQTVAEFAEAHNADLRSEQRLRLEVTRQLASLVRQVHAHGLIHRDLFVRNVLVNTNEQGHPKVWLIDSPRGGIVRWNPWGRSLGHVINLASLDRGAATICTRTERLRFLHQYLEKPTLDAEMRQIIRRLISYSLRRWWGKPAYAHQPPPIQSD